MNKKMYLVMITSIIAIMLFSVGCTLNGTDPADDGGNGGDSNTVIDIAAIVGVTAPAGGETPVTTITETDQYTGTVSWSPSDNPFDYETVYTATITLTAKSGYTLTGVTADFFTVGGASSVSNSADSGVVTAVFPETDAKVYAIGDTGPSGVGIVFYITDGGLHGLEVAPSDQSTSQVWIQGGSTQTTSNGNTETAIGTGLANSNAIIAQTGHTGSAAQVCRSYNGGGLTDWFLPSKDELDAIWDNLVDDGAGANSGVGGFANAFYWSSSESLSSDAWGQDFSSGLQTNYFKYFLLRVRAVRAF